MLSGGDSFHHLVDEKSRATWRFPYSIASGFHQIPVTILCSVLCTTAHSLPTAARTNVTWPKRKPRRASPPISLRTSSRPPLLRRHPTLLDTRLGRGQRP